MAISLIGSTVTDWFGQTASSKTCPNTFNVINGDILVAIASIYGGSLTGMSGGAAGWVLQQTASSASTAYIYTSTFTASQSFAPRVNKVGTSLAEFGACVLHFRGAAGIGISFNTIGSDYPDLLTPTLSGSNSALVLLDVNDAGDFEPAVWYTNAGSFTTEVDSVGESIASIHAGYHSDTGPAAAYTVGQVSPTGQSYVFLGLEVLNTGGEGGGGGGGASTAWLTA